MSGEVLVDFGLEVAFLVDAHPIGFPSTPLQITQPPPPKPDQRLCVSRNPIYERQLTLCLTDERQDVSEHNSPFCTIEQVWERENGRLSPTGLAQRMQNPNFT